VTVKTAVSVLRLVFRWNTLILPYSPSRKTSKD